MSFLEHPTTFDDAVLFSRFDEDDVLSTVSPHSFLLDDKRWLTAEHYYQSTKMRNVDYAALIAAEESAMKAYKLGNAWLHRKRKDFRLVRPVLMTRALYSKARQHPEVAERLLETEDRLLVETSQYDLFWGVGRDQRGQNQLGKIWMEIRKKLRAV